MPWYYTIALSRPNTVTSCSQRRERGEGEQLEFSKLKLIM